MIRLIIMGMTIALCALTGCVDYEEIQSLQSVAASLSNEVAQLKTRMAAVEEACLQINTRLVEIENRGSGSEQSRISDKGDHLSASAQSAISKFNPLAADTQTMKEIATLSESKPADRLTRSSFNRLVGMTVSEVLTILGKPDEVNEDAGVQSWGYRTVRLATDRGGVEASPALVVFEQGCVARAILLKDARDFPKPKRNESESTAGQTGQ